MRRRDFIVGASTFALSTTARSRSVPAIGVLGAAPALIDEERMLAFHRGLSEEGYADGNNVTISYLQADGQYDRLPGLAAEFVHRSVGIIVAPNSAAASLAAASATKTIPIVFSTTADPVQLGLVASFARPGGNITGIYHLTSDLGAKRVGLLRELAPAATTVAMLANLANPVNELGLQNALTAARAAGLEVRVLKASNVGEIDSALSVLAGERIDALIVINDRLFTSQRVQIVSMASRLKMPAIYPSPEYAEAGGLASYSPSYAEVYRQLGLYTGRIISGANPADLPVVQPTKFELVLNLRTAKLFGLAVSSGILAIADGVIE